MEGLIFLRPAYRNCRAPFSALQTAGVFEGALWSGHGPGNTQHFRDIQALLYIESRAFFGMSDNQGLEEFYIVMTLKTFSQDAGDALDVKWTPSCRRHSVKL